VRAGPFHDRPNQALFDCDPVDAFTILLPGGMNAIAELFLHCATQETAYRVRLPPGSFSEFLERDTARPP